MATSTGRTQAIARWHLEVPAVPVNRIFGAISVMNVFTAFVRQALKMGAWMPICVGQTSGVTEVRVRRVRAE
jgi:hypothetical protein